MVAEIEELLSADSLDPKKLELKCLGLAKQQENIKKLDEDIEETMDEADVENEISDAVAFSSKLDEAQYLAQQKLQEMKEAEVQAVQDTERQANRHSKTGRLPKLELPTFDGEPKKW